MDPYNQTPLLKDIEIQNNIFKVSGAIGRWRYFLNNLIVIITFSIIAFLISGINPSALASPDTAVVSVRIIQGLYLIAAFPLLVINEIKRITDIMGSRDNIIFWVILVAILSFIPVINAITGLFLCFKKGKISSCTN